MTACLLIPSVAWSQNTPPIANAGAPQTIFLGTSTVLQGSATDPDGDAIVSWFWSIDSAPEGSSASLSSPFDPAPVFTPNVLGDYVLSLVVSDGIDTSAPDTVTITVVENLPPVAVIAADVASGDAPLTVNFDGTGSFDPEGGALAYSWSFNDGSLPVLEAAPTHVFTSEGIYTVLLTVFDDFGLNGADSFQITVTVPGNTAPIATPTATPNSGLAPLQVQFAANATDADGDMLTYAWDFGDGATSADADPTHTYTAGGTYVVSLQVSDGQATASESVTVVVDPALALALTSVRVKQGGGGHTMGSVRLAADLVAPMPAANDLVSVVFDGITLLAAPFADFRLTNDGSGSSTAYRLRMGNARVTLDFANGTLSVRNNRIDLAALDDANGVDVELHIGDGSALETVVLSPAHGHTLVYDAASVP